MIRGFLLLAVLSCAMVLSGCGGGDDESPAAPVSSAPALSPEEARAAAVQASWDEATLDAQREACDFVRSDNLGLGKEEWANRATDAIAKEWGPNYRAEWSDLLWEECRL